MQNLKSATCFGFQIKQNIPCFVLHYTFLYDLVPAA